MHSQNEDLAAVVRSLTASPLFQLSLAAKELFHSSFLAWLCESHPQTVLYEVPEEFGPEVEIDVDYEVEPATARYDVSVVDLMQADFLSAGDRLS